ncbi:hypothetical protein JCM14202_3404 [Agrilactobacillus composti DSM 18527 = JCM 14202]|uniref:hypothetical protein n=1 Tax=Agrilactobacillus composti TaxID=398555 RepID=UPI00042DF5D8|nr:hypothetical protein [Agrilactobacillus composti]GAF41463.1 hypothetical protein JCM14202_3404 [Agrilactobacillus composti DSM 18527 = JCM 14202]
MSKHVQRIFKLAVAVFALVLAVNLGAGTYQAQASTVGAASTKQTKTITDQAGNKVTLPKNIKRVAIVGSIWPLPSVMAVFFNSADKIVSMPEPSMVAAKHSLLSELYPGILKAKTASNDGTSINTEELKKVKPDVVFYGAEDTKMQQKLTNAGFKAWGFPLANGRAIPLRRKTIGSVYYPKFSPRIIKPKF